MAASFRAHFRSPPPTDSSSITRKPSSRLSTAPSVADPKQSKAAQQMSKLARRASRSIKSLDKPEQGTKSAKSTPIAPVPAVTTTTTAARNPSATTKKSSAGSPSALPSASTPAPSSTRHHNLPLPPILRTPSLVSGSSASTFDSPRSNGLRRKPSIIDKYAAQKKSDPAPVDLDRAATHSRNEAYREAHDDSVLGISLPPTSTYGTIPLLSTADTTIRGYPSSREWDATRDVTPPITHYAQTATPSTRYADSPFSHAPTASSMSSYSSDVGAKSGSTPVHLQPSSMRSRPPVARRVSDQGDLSRLGLPPVRESSTSSSTSTIKPDLRSGLVRHDIPRKTAPTAPPVKSYQAPTSSSRRKTAMDGSERSGITAAFNKTPPLHIPRELAHLNVEPTRKPAVDKPLPPLRPSRDGATSLSDMSEPQAVVQSDLPRLYTTYHKRTPSSETPVSSTSPGLKSRFALSSKNSSRHASPRIDSAISPPPSARYFARGPTPEMPPPERKRLHRRDSPAVGTAPSPVKSPRFGLFSRKSKTEMPKVPERPSREPRKGPIAGTGHEGYGRFGVRGRSGSTPSTTGGRSSSADSSTSSAPRPAPANRKSSVGSSRDGSDMDEFLRERQTPVVLRGSGSTTSIAVSTSEIPGLSIFESSTSTSLDSYSTPQLLPSAMRDGRGTSPAKRPPLGSRMQSDSSEDDVRARYPTLAHRRSYNKLSQTDGKSSVRVPAPINTSLPPKQPSIDSNEVESSACPQTDSTLPLNEESLEGGEGLWLRPRPAEPPIKSNRKWNFFQRAQASPRPSGKGRTTEPIQDARAAAHLPLYRSVAHYATLDPVEPVGLDEVERIIQENETSAEDSMSESQVPPKMVPYERRHVSLLPSPPKTEIGRDAAFTAKPTPPRILVQHDSWESPELLRARTAVSQPMPHVVDIARSPVNPLDRHHTAKLQQDAVSTPEMAREQTSTPEHHGADGSPRQPRLSPVGRIPRVISRRDQDRKLPDNSFSRPFARTQPHPNVKPPGALYNQIRELASPIEGGSQPVSTTSTRSDGASAEYKGTSMNTNPPSVSTTRTSVDMHSGNDFIAFHPRKDSETSYSSSNMSWMAALAALPPQEDDPWNEYNDLLDDMMPQRTPLSAASSLGAPFQYSSMLYERSPSMPPPLQLGNLPPSIALPYPPRAATVPFALSVPQQVARFLQPSMSPLTPQSHTMSDFVEHYGSHRSSISTLATTSRTSLQQPNRSSLPRPSRTSVTSVRGSIPSISSSRYSGLSGHSRSASMPNSAVQQRGSQSSLTSMARITGEAQLSGIAEVDANEQAAAANLRFGALMTSKWLSFGRVLFSPANEEMGPGDDARVLVIDGLGSDWSYYVAMNYPAATIYNLGPAGNNASASWPGGDESPPPNHRHIPHSAISAAFPFPKGFFSAVVFRFPTVTTEEAYHACIFECKRVLRPGGYLEVAVLDIDLMNMGNKARKAVRMLKERMQHRDRNVSLRNVSDLLVRLVGRRGFEDVQRCIVGVPAAGRIPHSQDFGSAGSGTEGKLASRPRGDRRVSEKELSFADLLHDARNGPSEPNKNHDESITKMVAKVGRFWFSKCYETSLPNPAPSIWDDLALLRECEKQGTSFRLLICCAQKPTQTRRRTVSV